MKTRDLELAAVRDATAPSPLLQVLLVDDSPIVGDRLAALIQQMHRPIQIEEAQTGAEALAAFERILPAVVVLDLQLPDTNGFDLLAQFKLRRPDCQVIVLTTYAYPEFRTNALRLGATYFFDKAMEFDRVTEVLRGLTDASPTSA